MADHKGSSSDGVVSDDQLCRTVSNKQRVKDKLADKNLKPNPSSFVHCVCSSSEDSGHMVECRLVLNGLTANMLASFLHWLQAILMSA